MVEDMWREGPEVVYSLKGGRNSVMDRYEELKLVYPTFSFATRMTSSSGDADGRSWSRQPPRGRTVLDGDGDLVAKLDLEEEAHHIAASCPENVLAVLDFLDKLVSATKKLTEEAELAAVRIEKLESEVSGYREVYGEIRHIIEEEASEHIKFSEVFRRTGDDTGKAIEISKAEGLNSAKNIMDDVLRDTISRSSSDE